jgi:hypothetical protein
MFKDSRRRRIYEGANPGESAPGHYANACEFLVEPVRSRSARDGSLFEPERRRKARHIPLSRSTRLRQQRDGVRSVLCRRTLINIAEVEGARPLYDLRTLFRHVMARAARIFSTAIFTDRSRLGWNIDDPRRDSVRNCPEGGYAAGTEMIATAPDWRGPSGSASMWQSCNGRRESPDPPQTAIAGSCEKAY